ncbi:MAG: hypothetical protein KAJ40_08620, partial [Alphaproteobacteria bacterium]|nr:hypothetical protein [Alphaproteobacteria bacterium]
FDVTPEGIRKTESIEEVSEQEPTTSPTKRGPKTSDVIIAVLFIAVCVLLYPKIFNKEKFGDIRDEDGRISIAVMPFENLTGDTTLNWFQRGISSLIINGLGNSSELAVRDDHTMYEVIESMDQVYTSGISPSQAKEVAKKVQTETYISGSCQGSEDKYWILANLVDTESGEIIWTHKVEGDLKSSGYLDLANSLCNEIKNYLEIRVLEQETDYDFREAYPESADAYRYFIEGMNSIITLDYESAIKSFGKALEIDSTFTFASFYIAYAYAFHVVYDYQPEQRNIWIQNAYMTKDRLQSEYQLWLDMWYAFFISKDLQEIATYCRLLEEFEIESRLYWFNLGAVYSYLLQQYDKGIKAFEKVEEINLERGGDWKYVNYYYLYGSALHNAGKHEKEKEISEIGLEIYPKSREITRNMAVCALSQGDTSKANVYLEKLKSVGKELGISEAIIERSDLGFAYEEANIIDNAEVHYRKAYELEPLDIEAISTLANLLIKYDINVDEGMKLIRKGLEFEPDNPGLLQVQGWGCFKQGKFEEAIQLLRLTQEGNIRGSIIYELDQQILEVEQALASQN